MTPEIAEKYGNRVRLRVCGLCWQDNKLLMVNHKNLTTGNFWAPPGGGIEVGESAEHALVRELKEEANLTVSVEKFSFTCEFIQPPLHALELFFQVIPQAGTLLHGSDPELSSSGQIIIDARYMHMEEILALPNHERHGIFRLAKTEQALKTLTGFHRI